MAGRNLFADEAKPKGRNLFADQSAESQPAQVAAQPAEQQSAEPKDYGATGNVVMELANAINKGGADFVDFFVSDPINAAMQLSGSKSRVPTLNKIGSDAGITQGGFMEPGIARDVVRTAGELIPSGVGTGAAMRTAANLANPLVQAAGQLKSASVPASQLAQSATSKIVGQMGAGSTAGDIGYTALSGAGSVVGEEIGGDSGKLIGAFLAPVAGSAAKDSIKGLFNAGKSGFQALTQPLASMTDDGASTLLAEAMVREGLSPDDVIQRMNQLGPEAVPADIGNNFARLLRTASNKIPRIEGLSAEVLNARQAGQGSRILNSLDDATGTASLNVDDEIVRLDTALRPQIKALYDAAKSKPLGLSPRMRSMMEGKNSLSKAMKKSQAVIADKRAAGDEISNIDIIDATKQVMDDQIGKAIRAGENNKSRDLVRLKNIMITEADKAIPEYSQARNMFAGKAAMENAAQAGEMFVKMKPRDMMSLTKTYGEAERHMFKLGAKQSILDKIDDLQGGADSVRRLFGKNGDVKKLRYLFDDSESFRRFSDTLETEANFTLTRRAAQANSTTAKQLADDETAFSVLKDVATATATPHLAASTISRIVSGLQGKKTDKIYIKALEDVGDILLTRGIDQDQILSLLRNGTAKGIEARLKAAITKPIKKAYMPASIAGGADAAKDKDQSQQQ